ncbi:MAG: homocysteine S-methyltransferase family protein [Candidatus Lokiarchaeota archaeon]|nr:homocysteine S-methyltransferase family protein [Candidatus Harpocratesius repetitus]
MNIENEIYKRLCFFDGAMGTTLQKKGLKTGEVPEKLNFTHPELIRSIHREYAEAGAEMIKTNTFGANRYKLQQAGLEVEDVISQAINLVRDAAPGKLIALDIGPIGQMLAPVGPLGFNEAYSMFQEQVQAGVKAGADLILIETISDLYEAKVAILAAKENSQFPIFCTMTFQEDGRTLTGTDPETLVTVLEGLGIDALGVNCSLGPAEIYPIVEQIMQFASIPVIVQPNAGLPVLKDGETEFLITPEEYTSDMAKILELGVHIIGGCCGTTPEFIQMIVQEFHDFIPKPITSKIRTTCASPGHTVEIGKDIVIIGERINPTGKKRIKEALKKGDIDYLLQEGIKQKEAGAHILDVNVGLPEIDESTILPRISRELQEIIDIPLQFDSSNADALEKACRYYNGKPIINSVNGKAESMQKIFPIVKKYGCLVVALCLDERGLPKSVQDRIEIAEKIINTAKTYGIPKESLLVDCLTLTASAQQRAVQDSLEALRILTKKYQIATVLGASNVSYGLPARPLINRTYLAMALQCGLKAPITDPLSTDIMETIAAFRVLANLDLDSKDFIKKYKEYLPVSASVKLGQINQSSQSGKSSRSGKSNQSDQPGESEDESLQGVILKGLKSKIAQLTENSLKTFTPMQVVDTFLIPALDEVGRRYENHEIFLPQLIRSAETVKIAFNLIKERLKQTENAPISKGTVILATVEGDVHDIGKNIVKILLENYGYRVIDLGKDVPAIKIIDAIKQYRAPLVGLSALMTTTVISMQKIIKEIKSRDFQCQIMVGGAVLNPEFANKIGADFYGQDAKSAVNIAQKIFQV